MEVYLIRNKINNKIYIGSTIYTKEYRWNDKNSGFAHLNCAARGDNSPLYEDIRKFKENNFVLETLEFIEYDNSKDKNENRHIIQLREDYYIKKYWNKLGEEMMYNQMKSAFTNSNGHQLTTQKALAKRNKTNLERYGNQAGFIAQSKEVAKKRGETMRERKSAIFSEKSLINRSNKYIYKNKEIYGLTNLHKEIMSEGYELTWSQIRNLALYGLFSKENSRKYPELINSITCIRTKVGRRWL